MSEGTTHITTTTATENFSKDNSHFLVSISEETVAQVLVVPIRALTLDSDHVKCGLQHDKTLLYLAFTSII
jgi:hypothetical protein